MIIRFRIVNRIRFGLGLMAPSFCAEVANAAPAAPSASGTAPVVRIVKQDGGWRLMRNGKPYFIKGAVVGPGGLLDALQQAGGNSIRTHAEALDEAQRHGFTALVSLPLGNPRQGFNDADTNQVEQQFNRARETVRKYPNHHPRERSCRVAVRQLAAPGLRREPNPSRLASRQ